MKQTKDKTAPSDSGDFGKAVVHARPFPARNDHSTAQGVQQPAGNMAWQNYARRGTATVRPMLQKFPAPGAPMIDKAPEATTPGLIAEDTVKELTPGQIRKSRFLAEMQAAVCGTAQEALSGTIWSAAGCPWIDYWFSYYSRRSSQAIERAILRYAPAAGNASTALDYIPAVCGRVRQAISIWADTGEISGVPEGAAMDGAGAPQDNEPETANAGPQLKPRSGQAQPSDHPQDIAARMGRGRPLEGGVRTRMASAFGRDFSGVRIHADAQGQQLSEDLQARAFTIGNNIAFGKGEYQPGTPVGDALIAHELAHTVQQAGGVPAGPVASGQEASGLNLENEADLSAVSAVVSLWSGMKDALAGFTGAALPRLRAGLRLQRCRRTVKKCPAGMSWQVQTELGEPQAIGTGPVCWCVWRCRPAPAPPAPPNSVTCYPRPCSSPSYETVEEDYQIKDAAKEQPSWVLGPGGHFTPLGGKASCGCIPLDIEGEGQSSAPLIDVGLQLTDLAGMRGKPARDPRTGVIAPPTKAPKALPPKQPPLSAPRAVAPKQPPPLIPASAGGGGKGGKPLKVIVVGAETKAEFAYAKEVAGRGHDVTVVNPRVSKAAQSYQQGGGRMVVGKIEGLPKKPTADFIREDFPFPLGRSFQPTKSFVEERMVRLKPGGKWVVVTESVEFGNTLKAAAELGGGKVTTYNVPEHHEATPKSTYPRESQRLVIIVEKQK